MADKKGFSRFLGVFRREQWCALQSGFRRLYSRKHQKLISYSSENARKNSSLNIWNLELSNFQFSLLTIFIILLALIFPTATFSAEEQSDGIEQILEIESIQELMQVDIEATSANKRPELVHKTASAVYVLTGEDIRRSGAVNIMEALRMVPGVLVSKTSQNTYTISIRGFNRREGSDKLLVLMDGRTIYSPVAAGVFWIGQDTVLEDIERIEVIRGPGAALWGSNAVAGVINIITKNSKDTQGGLVAGGVGTEEEGFATLRFGGKLENDLNYRVYSKYRNRDDGIAANGNDAFDDKQIGQGGFRTDWQINKQDHLTMQGDYYRLNSELDIPARFTSLATPPAPFQGTSVQEGANFLTRWNHTFDDKSSYKLQLYYDRLKQKSGIPLDNVVEQFDIDFQHNFSFAKVHNFSWGLNYRYAFFDIETTNLLQSSKDTTHLGSLFLHDEIQLIPDELSLILGVKAEYNVFTGMEFQPSVRTAWNPHPDHTIWAAFSRAVRIPTISEENGTLNRTLISPGFFPPFFNPVLIQQVPNSGLKPEVLLAYEVGYRVKASKKVNFDFTAYYFDYDNLIDLNDGLPILSGVPGTPDTVPVFPDNSVEGEIYGVEISGQWQVLDNWRLSGSYTFAEIQLRPFPGAPLDAFNFNAQGDLQTEGEPKHLFNIRSYLNLPHNLEFDTFYYYVSKNESRSIPEYGRLDIRLGWKPIKNVDLSFVAQNLLDPFHPELNELREVASETQRSYYLKATLKF